MRTGIRSIVVCFWLLGCGDGGTDSFTLSVVVQHDERFSAPTVSYEIHSDSAGIDENGDVPLVFLGGSVPPAQRWELIAALPSADDYQVALDASLVGSFRSCSGTADFSVPPRRLGVWLDCRADPTGPPVGVQLGPQLLYIDGNLEVD